MISGLLGDEVGPPTLREAVKVSEEGREDVAAMVQLAGRAE